MRTAKRILAEFMTVIMVLQACSPTVAAVAAGWQNISSEIAAAAAEASDTVESGETNGDAVNGSGASDAGAAGDGAQDGAAKDDAAAGGAVDSVAGSDSAGDQTEGGDTAADDTEHDADTMANEDAETLAGATITDLNKLVELLEKNGAESIVRKDGESGIKSLDVTSSEAFAVLSNADASLYYDAQIKVIITGDAKLTESANNGMSFQGLGSDERPFEGRIYRSLSDDDSPVELTTDRTVFNNLKLSDQNKTVRIKWVGATSYSAPMVASKVSGAENSEESKTLIASVDIADPVNADVKDTTSALTAPLLGTTTGNLTANVTYSLTASRKNLNANATGNIGLIGNTVESGTLTVESVTFPNDLASGGTVKTSSGNAGLLVGEVKDGATLSIGALTNVPTTTVRSTNGSAGGVVGLVGSSTGGVVNVTQALNLHSLTVKGTTASGGLIGKATNLSLTIADGITIKPARNVGDENSACSGGVIGDVSFAQGFTVTPDMFGLGDLVTLGASQRAGALFGMADISNGDIVVQGGTYKSKLASGKDGVVSGSYGGLVGKVFATAKGDNDALRAFVVQKDADNKKACSIEFDLASGLSDAGGVVGYVGDNPNSQPVAVVLNDVTVACKGDASARTATGKLGGAVGVVDTRSVLDVRDFTLTSDNAIGGAANNRAAGIAGSAWNALIKFSGITNLSGARFAANGTTGQLVYENNNALIFAIGNGSNGNVTDEGTTGWTYKRSGTASKTDDIATYGEVIRLGNSFIALDPITHKLTSPTSLTSGGGAYTLTSVEDFAKLAITWQTNGYYSMVEGVTENNLNGLQSSTITVNGTIDLAGTGLTGFTQDRASDSQVFSGTLNGSGTINLAVGEAYGMRGGQKIDDDAAGNGKIYRHGRLGLFAAINGATVSDVTIKGSMKFDNQSNVDAGALAGVKVGGDTSLTSVKFGAGVRYESTNKDGYVHVGSIIGGMSGVGSLKIGNRESPSIIKANIVSKAPESGVTCVGGAVGYVASDCLPSAAGKTVEVGGLNVSGSITINDGSTKTYAGGFIGQIAQGEVDAKTGALKSVKKVEITKLDFASFSLATTGSKTNSSGGFLGYSWAGTEVTLGRDSVNANGNSYAITTNGSSVKSAYATELGGLVYAASGHWIINNYAINLAGASFIADSATTLGVLIARGSTSVSDNSFGAETSYSGLYLEDRAWWGTAYAVGGVSITAPKVETYDEWLANGVKPNSKLIDNGCNAVVSLHTNDEKLDMSGDPAKDNSYQNRISPDKLPKINGSVRYYYNLDRALTVVTNSKNDKAAAMITPEHLVLWAARQYAPSATYDDLTGTKKIIFTNNKIGLDQGNQITIDLTGYSYYPSNPNGSNAVTVQNVKIVFCYSQIRAGQENNKSNAMATQHENMHCGLIRTIGGKGLTVTGVTLSGTVGRVKNDRAKGTDPESVSGALVLRCAYGSSGTKMSTINIDTLTLDGLQVDGAEDKEYAPLLINAITRYVNLDVKNVTTSNYADNSGANKTAASSLFGNLGDEKAVMVTANFQGITVPSSKTNGIFTHASLIESFAYDGTKSGSSASYIFYSKNHEKEDSSFTYCEPTYGAEIDSKGNDSEYEGQQRWYNDEKGYMTDDNLVTDGSITANEDKPQFANKYLPYVYKSKEGSGEHAHDTYHEIKVNQRVSNLLTGCGTYGDPYALTNAAEIVTVANYINGRESAADGWQITVIDNQDHLCTRRDNGPKNFELVYEYKRSQGSWVCTTDSSKTLSNDTMHSYIQSAYYSIEPADSKSGSLNYIGLDGNSFKGFGNKDNPFRGVIVGDLKKGCGKATLKIVRKTRTISGVIPYSYGCVVKNLNVEYSDGGSVAAGSNVISYANSSDGIPTSFFGGIFGCILGGDNIIDGVAVSSDGFTVAANSHLVPIGGYVGAIAGGGVIFRNMSGTSWRDGTKTKFKSAGEGGANFQLYDNPYVGRVIDGYAFSEGESCTVDNGDANYKINKLKKTNKLENKDTPCVIATAASGGTAARVTPTSAQGLLVLSAIINSGAASGGVSLAYEAGTYDTKTSYKFGNARYGKVRNATYEHVGNPASAADDFKRSTADDQSAPGFTAVGLNLPYLVNSYADAATGSLCASSGVELQLASNEPYNMTSYGRGFTGLSGRYVSNACASSKGVDRDCIVPRIACINGNGATVTVDNKTREYVDDDYCVAGVGGLFNTITFVNNPGSVQLNVGAHVKDLAFYGCNISLTYISSAGAESSISNKVPDAKNRVGIGCFAGSTANQDKMTGVFKRVRLEKCSVLGGSNAGGLIGTAGWMGRSTNSDTNLIADAGNGFKVFPVQLYDCSYSELEVTSLWCAGGFVGSILSGASGIWTTNDLTVASNSRITIAEIVPKQADDGCIAGGVFGLAGGETDVNTNQGISSTQVATIKDVTIAVNQKIAVKPKAVGIGGVVGQANKQVSARRVRVTSTKEPSADSPTYFGSLRAVDNGDNSYGINAGGLAGTAKAGVSADSCTVEKIRMGVTEHAGGLVGATSNGNTLSSNNITVDGVQFDGARCGGILGNCQAQGATNVVVTNATVQNCSFGTLNSAWNHSDGNLRNHSGGIVGAASGTIKIANVLISKNDFKQPGGQGFLLGDTAQNTADFKGLYAAGVDIVLKDRSGNSSTQKPIKYFNDSAVADVNQKSYIAFGDYNDKLAEPEKGKTLYGADAADSMTAAVSPYVTTSPVSSLSVQTASGDAGQTRYLFGDGVNVSSDEKTIQDVAKTIQDDAKKNDANHYIYNNIGGINDNGAYQNTSSYDADSVRSTFNENSGNNIAKDHFLVLVISGSDNTTVKSYLNIITNGGFSDACRLNNENGTNPHVTAKAEVFQLKDGVFVKDDDASNNPTLRVVNNGKNNMSFSPSSDWDNGKGRFTLLTVTFTEAGQSYNVQVPIVVKRKLEIDFTATYDYGTNFKESDYANLGKDAHVLTSFGEPMTGLLTWTYNSANGKEVDFGWDSYMAAGGSMKGLGKSILFNGADGRLPQGTQLTLIDANVDGKAGGREYHYTVGEGGATSVSLSGNAGFKDSAGNPYQERWLSEILGVSATQDGAGTWTACDNEAEATAKAKFKGEWTLFKVAGADVPSRKRYRLEVPKDKDSGRELRASESVYLVVNVPKSGNGGTQANINGFTASSIDSNSSGARISWNLHHVLRAGGDDNQNGTASTYSILSNYGQEVNDGKSDARTPVSKSTDGAAYVLSLDVTDTITFNPSQNYADSDSLFYQLDTSLCKYGTNDNLTGVSSFPSGTSAIAKFYVAIGDQNYRWNGSNWEPCDASTPAFTQTVMDTGNDSLKLMLDHDLAGIRKRATGGSFTVRTVVEEIRLTPDGCNKVIALSQQSGEDAYTRMSYTAKLSTREEGLDTSSLTQTKRGHVGYYRMDKGDATITLSAPEKSQLGINVDDLRPIANGTIGLGATYELGGLNNATETIKNADSVVYTLTLQRRSGTNGSYEDVTDGISNYVTVTESKLATVSDTGNAITFTDTKKDGAFGTKNGDTTFNLPFTVKVNTQAEQSEQFYANYRLVMTASLVTGGVASAMPQSPDYVTYTLTRVNLNGIDH